MKTLLRTLLYFALIVWLGAEIFFPSLPPSRFNTLQPDTHTAGTIVGQLLRILHGMGLVSGMVALAVLALAPAWGIYKPRAVLAPMVLLVLMIGAHGLLAVRHHSRDGARPHCRGRRDRHRGHHKSHDGHFNKLHNRSEFVRRRFCCWGWRRWCWWRAETTRRVTYEGMAAHWKTATGEDADFMNKLPKLVASETLEAADWNNTQIVRGNVVTEIQAIKERAGGPIFVFGSAKLSATLFEAGLFDEVRLALLPIVIGNGATLFGRSLPQAKMKLLETRPTSNGCVILRYEPE
jgi:dihydrofolate reductase